MNQATINLEAYRTPEAQVFTGRDRGKDVRRRSHIDELIKNNDQVLIVIPNDIFSINPSFLEEFLQGVVLSLGSKEGFESKVKFENNGRYKVEDNLDAAVKRILRASDPL
jgi:hypothetical protein